jgi:hypothetical protein
MYALSYNKAHRYNKQEIRRGCEHYHAIGWSLVKPTPIGLFCCGLVSSPFFAILGAEKGTYKPEAEFVSALGARESIAGNRSASLCSPAGRYDKFRLIGPARQAT